MPQQINLNVSPYYDDYDPTKNYYQVVFKPGTPVQARELTTLQSILQNQIEKFGNHIFKDGARVSGGELSYNGSQPVVILDEIFQGYNVEAILPFMTDFIIRGRTSGVRARIKFYISARSSEIGKPSVYIDYLNPSPTDPTIKTFLPGEVLESENEYVGGNIEDSPLININSGDAFATTFAEYPTSVSNFVYLNPGVYYIRGKFLSVYGTRLILDQYTNTGSYKVGFYIYEEIYDSGRDESLLDNSKGFNNYAAPGADRLRISVDLIKIPIDQDIENFILLKEIRDGLDISQPFTTQYNELSKEFARRTFDESGDYYVKPTNISIRESLNDLKGNNGLFKEGTLTYSNNTANENLATYVISPLKAYVRGYEVGTNNPTYIDFQKPRTTKTLENQQVIYNTGSTFTLNRVYGSPIVGIGNTYYLSLRDSRVGDNQTIIPGKEIGLARVYDFALESGSYDFSNQNINEWDISLYDTQTYTEITLNEPITLSTPTHIKGRSSGATAFLRYDISSSGIITAYNVTGQFSLGESFIFDGVSNNRISIAVTSYGLKDVKSIYGTVGTAYTFSADVKQSVLYDVGSATITAKSSGISTVSTPNFIFDANVKPGDLISYTISGKTDLNFSKIQSVSVNSAIISGITTVSGICEGELPSSTITISDLKVITSGLQVSSDNTLYTKLPKNNVESVDLTDSSIIIRKQFDVSITSNSTNTISAGSNETFLPFDEERYCLIREDGTTENLSSDKLQFSSGGTQLVIRGLGTNSNAKLIATLRKTKISSKNKTKNKVNSIIVDKSINIGSGVGGTTLNNGLTYGNYPYGTRVEDTEICLLSPDVTKIYAIIESNDTNEPDSPSLTFSSLNGTSSNTDDLLIGEEIIGQTSEAVAIYTKKVNNLKVEFIRLNSNNFIAGEIVTFKNSSVEGRVSVVDSGDKNITENFEFNNNQINHIYDYSKIVRKKNTLPPSKKIKIIFESASFNSSDNGDLITVNSYKDFSYCDIPKINGIRCSDIIDIRPRVSSYSVQENVRSPFEFLGRTFNQQGSSVSNILASDEDIYLNYSFYLPRIDRIFITKNGVFQVNYGDPDEVPKLPKSIEDGLELASVYLPPYLCDLKEATINLLEHKRYRMVDIRKLEQRIENLEYYTSLSLLESNTSALQIKDANGLDRFKSGFYVDDFSSNINQKKVTLVKNSIDIKQSELRPTHYTTSIDLILGDGSILGVSTSTNQDLRTNTDIIGTNIKRTGRVITLDYDEVSEIIQPYSTKIVNVVPYASAFYGGTIELVPSSDVWVDQVRLEAKTIEAEGNYLKTATQEDFDPQTGYAPSVWNSWETTWTGSSTKTSTNQRTQRSGNTTQYFQDTVTTITKTGTSTRTGQQQILKEQIDNVSFGDAVLNKQVIPYSRSRNVEFTAKRLKPFTRFYPFFDGIDFTSYVFPKLIEIEMITGTFQVGETVKGFLESIPVQSSNDAEKVIFFRASQQNHKYGAYNNPTDIYTANPYDSQNIVPEIYSETSTLLNIDTFSLSSQPQGAYYGYVIKNMRLIGLTSGAEAIVKDVRLVTDNVGTLIGSFFIPSPNIDINPKFESGENVFRITTSSTNSQLLGSVDSSAEETYYSDGSISTVQENVILMRNARVETVPLSESKSESQSSSTTSSTLTRTVTDSPPTSPPRTIIRTPSVTPPIENRYEGFAYGYGTIYNPGPITGATGLINQNDGGSQANAFNQGRASIGEAGVVRAFADGYSGASIVDWIKRENAGVGCKAAQLLKPYGYNGPCS